ncbi:MAG TPA: ankyrin repeat domain-containing protein [Burkholderiaceae bacterium]|nr:ankyrin repeat domain-containing protein [Burkholderiaceae bacterium]
MKLTSNFKKPIDLSLADEKPYGDETPVRYERSDGKVSSFEGSEKAAKLHNQFRVGVDQLKAFLKENTDGRNKEAQSAEEGLDLFGQRVAHGSKGYYGPLIETLYGEGKAALDALCSDVKNERIPLTKRVSAVQDLGEGVKVCNQGTLSNLIITSSDLRKSTLGVEGHSKAIWESMLDQALREYCQRNHGHEETYLRMEIHYVNGYREHLARKFGVAARPDMYVPRDMISKDRIEGATAYARKRVNANTLLVNLAESCLAEIRERFKEYVDRPLSEEDSWGIYSEYEEAFQGELQGRYGKIESSVLVSAYEGKGTEDAPYRFIEHPALLMRAIGRNLKQAGLFKEEKFKVESGESGIDVDTGRPMDVRVKRIMRNVFYLKEKVEKGETRYRSPQLQNLVHLESIPWTLLKGALMANPDKETLARLSAESVWKSMLEENASWDTDMLKTFMSPPVKRFRDVNFENHNILEKRMRKFLGTYPPGQMQEVMATLLSNGEIDLAYAVAKKFISKLDSLDWHDEDGNNVVHLVAKLGIEKIFCELLMTRKAEDFRKRNLYDETPLELAARHGQYWTEGLQDLYLDCPLASDGSTLLHEAVRSGSAELTRKIVAYRKLDINAKTRNGRGQTALMEAVDNEDVKIIGLLARPSDLTILDENRLTPMMRAIAGGKEKSLKALLEAGADPNYCTPHGKTALTTAVEAGDLRSMIRLVRSNADVNAPRGEITPLVLAAEAGRVDLVSFLLKKGAVQDDAGATWQTPVLLAAQAGHADVVDRLTRDVNSRWLAESPRLRTRLGSALFLAAGNGHRDVVRVLLSLGVRNEIDDAIDHAESNGHGSVVALLRNPARARVEQIVQTVLETSRGWFRSC